MTLAQDYLTITDQRATGDIVMVIWVASPLISANTPNAQKARDLLDKYALVGTVHAKVSINQAFESVTEADPKISDAAGAALTALDDSTFPPAIVGTLAVTQNIFAKSLGPLGQSVHWTVVSGASAKPCQKGGLRVNYAGVDYTYDMPVPGCP